MYLKISGAGLVTMFFALFLSPTLSIPIRLASESGLSNGQDLISRGSASNLRIQPQTRLINDQTSSAPTTTIALTDDNSDDPQLVRRNSHIGEKIKKGFQKAVNWVKKTGAQIAKFGLKVVQTVATAASKVLSKFGPTQSIGKAIGGFAKGAGAASDAIKANFSGKIGKRLEKGMHAMNKINDKIPRDLSEVEAVQQREVGDGFYFEERDDIALDYREESYFDADE